MVAKLSEKWPAQNVKFRKNNREAWQKYKREWRAKNRYKVLAHRTVERAVKNGTLVKQSCEVCGEMQTVAHHDDYNKHLQVSWLCQEHHVAWHKVNKPIEFNPNSERTVIVYDFYEKERRH